LKNSFDPFGNYWSFFFLANLPFRLPDFIIKIVSSKPTMMYSNVNAIKRNILYNGKQFRGGFYFVPTIGEQCCGLSLASIGDYVGFSAITDECGISDPDEFMKIYIQKYNDAMAEAEKL